jgi:hypothetical protein
LTRNQPHPAATVAVDHKLTIGRHKSITKSLECPQFHPKSRGAGLTRGPNNCQSEAESRCTGEAWHVSRPRPIYFAEIANDPGACNEDNVRERHSAPIAQFPKALKVSTHPTTRQAKRKNMKMSVIAFACLFVAMVAHQSSAAARVLHFPPCPDGVVDKKRCECRAFVSRRFNICERGQHCLRNAFHGMCW